MMMRQLRAEGLKHRHTVFYPLHVGLPAVFMVALFIFRHALSNFSPWSLTFQSLGLVLPFVIAMVCSLSHDLDIRQNIKRYASSSTKFTWLVLLYGGSLVLALLGASLVLPSSEYSISSIAQTTLALMLCGIPLYALHLFIAQKFGSGINNLMGILGVLLSALGVYHPFDTVGYLLPQTWFLRLSNLLLSGHQPQLWETLIRIGIGGMIIYFSLRLHKTAEY